MTLRTLALASSLSLVSLSVSSLLFGVCQVAAFADTSSDYAACDPEREAQARRLIDSATRFMETAREHHKATELLIAEAKKLKGQARILEKKTTTPPSKRLSPTQYKAALTQFDQDVQLFKQHANAYNQHIDAFRKQLGECSANQAAYEAQAREYTLHSNRYHIPNVPPPHICITLDMTESEAQSMAHTYRNDRERLVKAEAELRNQENLLGRAEANSNRADEVLMKQADRAQREREIAGEFAKLKQEYELIEIQRKALDNSGVKHKYAEAQTKVQGSVKQK